MDAAMKTAIRLCEFEDILEPWDVYSLVALTALQNKFYGICSKALVKVTSSSVATMLFENAADHMTRMPWLHSWKPCLTSRKIVEISYKRCVSRFSARKQIGRASCRERVCQYV